MLSEFVMFFTGVCWTKIISKLRSHSCQVGQVLLLCWTSSQRFNIVAVLFWASSLPFINWFRISWVYILTNYVRHRPMSKKSENLIKAMHNDLEDYICSRFNRPYSRLCSTVYLCDSPHENGKMYTSHSNFAGSAGVFELASWSWSKDLLMNFDHIFGKISEKAQDPWYWPGNSTVLSFRRSFEIFCLF